RYWRVRTISRVFLPHVVHHIESDGLAFGGGHHVDLGGNPLAAEIKDVRRPLAPPGNLFGWNVGQRLAGTDGRTHGPLADGSSVVAHVALHHLLLRFHHFRDSKRAGQHAVVAGNTPGRRWARRSASKRKPRNGCSPSVRGNRN